MTVEINYTENVIAFIKAQSDRYNEAIREASIMADAREIFDLEERFKFMQETVDDILGERP